MSSPKLLPGRYLTARLHHNDINKTLVTDKAQLKHYIRNTRQQTRDTLKGRNFNHCKERLLWGQFSGENGFT